MPVPQQAERFEEWSFFIFPTKNIIICFSCQRFIHPSSSVSCWSAVFIAPHIARGEHLSNLPEILIRQICPHMDTQMEGIQVADHRGREGHGTGFVTRNDKPNLRYRKGFKVTFPNKDKRKLAIHFNLIMQHFGVTLCQISDWSCRSVGSKVVGLIPRGHAHYNRKCCSVCVCQMHKVH